MTRTYSLEGRHTSIRSIMRWFTTNHLTESTHREIVQSCEDLALEMIGQLPDDPELTAGLRHLVEAKDCFVRANVARLDDHGQLRPPPEDKTWLKTEKL